MTEQEELAILRQINAMAGRIIAEADTLTGNAVCSRPECCICQLKILRELLLTDMRGSPMEIV